MVGPVHPIDKRVVIETVDTLPPELAQRLPGIHLASRSSRRRELLDEHGIPHEAAHPGVEDSFLAPGAVTPEQWTGALAYLKARAGASELHARTPHTHRLVIGADTVCVKNGHLLGTPADRRDAERILRTLLGGGHRVVTGVAIICSRSRRRVIAADSASVRLGSLGDEDLQAYLDSGNWLGKAGAYNLRERIEAGWPITFEGDPSTVMGLPMGLLTRLLRRFAEDAEPAP